MDKIYIDVEKLIFIAVFNRKTQIQVPYSLFINKELMAQFIKEAISKKYTVVDLPKEKVISLAW